MNFDDLFANVCEALQREQRISYRALRRRFELSDDDLEDITDELIYAKKWVGDEVLGTPRLHEFEPPMATPR